MGTDHMGLPDSGRKDVLKSNDVADWTPVHKLIV